MKSESNPVPTFANPACPPAGRWAAMQKLAAAVFLLGSLNLQVQAQYALSNIWVSPATTTSVRDIGYSSISNQVFIANTGGSIAVYDGTAGTSIGSVSFSGLTTSGTQVLNQMGVANDGVIYGANLTTAVSAGSPYRIYRWPSWNSPGQGAYGGDPTTGSAVDGLRVGDSFAITGSGTNTMIVIGIASKAAFILFSTVDGINFTPTVVTNITGLGTVSGEFGLAFYTNNTFMVKPNGSTTISLVQFPAGFGTNGGVTGTVLATSTLSTPSGPSSSADALFSYNPAASLLGVTFTGSSTLPSSYYGQLYKFTFAGGPTLLASTNFTASSNGNLTGGVALGGAGNTNNLYVLNSANPMQAYQILLTPPQPPTISPQPIGGSVYPPYTLTVSATGATPLSYQWRATNAAVAGSFTNIPGATTNTLTLTGVSTNFYEVVVTNIAGAQTSSVVLVTTLKAVTNSAVTNLWQVAAGQSGYPWLSPSDNNERGIAYDTNSQRVVVSSTSGLYVLNANNGTNIEQLSLTGVTFGGLLSGNGCDQVGIADDGAVYAGNLNNAGANFNLWRWSAPSNIVTATQAFGADPGSGSANSERWGDTMAVRGAGPNTQILLASRAAAPAGTNVALLLPNDGVGLTYSSSLIGVSGVPAGFAGYGISFGAGNTFWAKASGGGLYEIAFDTNTFTGTVVFAYSTGQFNSALIGVGVDPINNILASVQPNDTPNDLQLFQLTGTPDSPVLFEQAFFASANANGNFNAAITVKYPRAYTLDVNNGIVAVTYGAPASTVPTIATPPASVTAYTNIPSVTFTVSASGSLPLYYQWRLNSNNITGATSSTYTLTNPPLSKAGYYDVVVHNIAGAITSTPPALLTLIIPVTSPQVTPVWSIGPGTNGAYLTTSGYETRGLAFDLTTSNLLVADHANIYLYNGTNGAFVSSYTPGGLPTGGINNWTIDQLGVADDGILYSCNLTPDGTAFSIAGYGGNPYQSPYPAYGGNNGADDLNSLDPIGDRWGDTMAIRGSGPDTQILFGSYNGTNVALFTTPDGTTFYPTLIAVQGGVPLGFAGEGIAFGPTNTFYAKGGHFYNMRWVSFDTNADTGTVLQTYTAGSQVPNDLAGLGVDVTNNILGGVCYNDTPHDVQLYLLSGNSNAPYLFDQDFFPATNPNSQENAVVDLKGGWGFGLDVNNGIVAFNYSLPSAPAVTLTTVTYAPGNTALTWNNTFDNHMYQVQYRTNLLTGAWTNLGSPVTATAETASYTDVTAAGATRFYRVISQ